MWKGAADDLNASPTMIIARPATTKSRSASSVPAAISANPIAPVAP